MSHGRGYEVRLASIEDAEQVAPVWTSLCAATRVPLFLSWEWIGTWLECLPPGERPLLLSAWRDDRPHAACLLVQKSLRRHYLLPSRVLFVNVTGERDYNLNPEYNGILASDTAAKAALLDFLCRQRDDWDEIHLPAVTQAERDELGDLARAQGLRLLTQRRSRCYRVDLAALRAGDGDYRQGLSRNARYQLNRACRAYRRLGEVRIEAAADLDTALAWFANLKILHTRSWHRRGKGGAFDKRYWEPFHRRLIERLFPTGRIQMLRIRAGTSDIGYLYNILDGGEVLFIQSGFNYAADPHLKPGYVSHALAIEENLRAGNDGYNFLAGDERYKKTLARAAEPLSWLSIQRPRLRFGIENCLRRLLRPRAP